MQTVCSSGKVDDIIYIILKNDDIIDSTIIDKKRTLNSTHVSYDLAIKWVDDYIKSHIHKK